MVPLSKVIAHVGKAVLIGFIVGTLLALLTLRPASAGVFAFLRPPPVNQQDHNLPPQSVPEPGALLLLGSGVCTVLGVLRFRRRK